MRNPIILGGTPPPRLSRPGRSNSGARVPSVVGHHRDATPTTTQLYHGTRRGASMERSTQERIVRAYFDAIDQGNSEPVRPHLSHAFIYTAGDGTTFSGQDAIDRYIGEIRGLTDTTHRTDHLLHGDAVSVAEGIVSGTGPDDGAVEVGFCDVFVFSDSCSPMGARSSRASPCTSTNCERVRGRCGRSG